MSVRGELHLTGNGEMKIVPLETPRFTIGRGQENSLCLPVSVVSRLHTELARIGNDFLLRDLGSTNGSFVNGERVSERLLNDGDQIRLGANGPEITFHLIASGTGEVIELKSHIEGRTSSLIESLTGKLQIPQKDICEEANLRRVLAEAHLNKGEHDRALEILTKYNDTTILIALPIQFRAAILLWIGRVYLERKQRELALDALTRSLNFYQQAADGKADDVGVGEAQASLGRAWLNAGDFLASRDHLHRAMVAARRSGSSRLRAEVHYLLGKVDWKEGDVEGARYNWGRASRLADETNDAMLRGRVQMQEALLLYTEGKLKESVPVYQASIQQFESAGNVRLLLKAQSSLSRVLTRLGSWTATEQLLADRLRLARERKLAKAEAIALTDQAELKYLQGDLDGAMKSIELARRRHGATPYARTQRIYGRILQTNRQTDAAIQALETGLAAARERGSIEEQVLTAMELAAIYADGGKLVEARAQLEAAESFAPLDPALNLMARALYTRGLIQARAAEFNEANRSFSQSLSIFQTISDPFRAALCHAALGSLRLNQSRFESARAHLEQAQQTYARLGALTELRRVEALLSSASLANVPAAMTMALPGLSGTARLSLAHKAAGGLTGLLQPAALPGVNRILVAVANDELAALLKRGLEVENYFVERVQDGREALERAAKQPQKFQLLLLDALLEHRSGFDVCRELRKLKRETPIILLGGRQGLEDKIEALQSGADDFLSKKGFIFEELMAKIEALLR